MRGAGSSAGVRACLPPCGISPNRPRGALLLAGAGVVSALWPPPWPGRWLGAVHAHRACSSRAAPPVPPGGLRVTVLDVGQGLSVLVQTAGHALLYDAGPAFRDSDAGERVVVPVLQALGVRQLDVLLISHADADHRGGAASVLERHPRRPGAGPGGRQCRGAGRGPARRAPPGAGTACCSRFCIPLPATLTRMTMRRPASCAFPVRARACSCPGDIEAPRGARTGLAAGVRPGRPAAGPASRQPHVVVSAIRRGHAAPPRDRLVGLSQPLALSRRRRRRPLARSRAPAS